jgi:hypothetical protein
MGDAAQINALRAQRVPTFAQVLYVPERIGLKNAVFQPRARLRLNLDLDGHDNLL